MLRTRRGELIERLFPGKDRREKGDFIGAAGVIEHLKNGPPRRRIGMIVDGAPARGT